MKLIHRIAGDLTRLMTERDQIAHCLHGRVPQERRDHLSAPEVACLITDMEREWMELLKSTQDAEDILEEKEKEVEELQFALGGMTADRDKHEAEADKRYAENVKLNEELLETKKKLEWQEKTEDWDVAEMEGIIDDLNTILKPKGCEGNDDIVDTVQLLVKVAPTCNYCPTILISDRHPDIKITSGSCDKCMAETFRVQHAAAAAKMKKMKEETK